MALPAGVTKLGQFKGSKGDTGSLAFATAEKVGWNENPDVEMVGPESNRGAHFKIPIPLPTPEAVNNDDATEALVKNPTKTNAALAQSFGQWLLSTDPRVGMNTTDSIHTAWNTAMSMLAAKGGTFFILPGIYTTTQPLAPIPSGVTVRGAGIDYADVPTRGTVIRCGWTLSSGVAAGSALVTLGNTTAGSGSGSTSGMLADINLDGMNIADIVLLGQGRRRSVHNVFARQGRIAALDWHGQNGAFTGYNVWEQNGFGDNVILREEPDNKFFSGSQFRGRPAANGAVLHLLIEGTSSSGGLDSGNLVIDGAHLWTGANGQATDAAALIWIDLRNSGSAARYQSILITGCSIEGVRGPQVRVTVGTGCVLNSLNVTDNVVFQNSNTDDATHPFVLTEGPGTITDALIANNSICGNGATKRYKSILHDVGPGLRGRFRVDGNVGRYVQYPLTRTSDSVLEDGLDMGANTVLATSSITRKTRERGTVTWTGDGSSTSYTFSSGLGLPLKWAMWSPRSTGASLGQLSMDVVGGTSSDQLIIRSIDTAGAASAPPTGRSIAIWWEAVGKPFVTT